MSEVNCLYTKVLLPFLEREVGPEASAAICRAAGRSREYLMADHNWIPLALSNELMRLGQELTGDPDTERWIHRLAEFGMDWKPREERSYLGTYSMGVGEPRGIYAKFDGFYPQSFRFAEAKTEELGRSHARMRFAPRPGYRMPLWCCRWNKVTLARFPTNWGLPRAQIVEHRCAVEGADACVLDITWKNPSLGRAFWGATAAGAVCSALLSVALAIGPPPGAAALGIISAIPLLGGAALGVALRERQRRRHTQRLLQLQSEEILFSNDELEKKFRDLEAKIEQLSLLGDLAAAVSATLDPEKIYEQALQRLVQNMGYQDVSLFLIDHSRHVVREHRIAGGLTLRGQVPLEFRLDAEGSAIGKVALTGLPLVVSDVEATAEPVHRPTTDALSLRSFVMVPLRVKERVFGVLVASSTRPGRFGDTDVELLSAVVNHVALAIDRAESFRTIEDLSRGLEDKVRVRTEQLRIAHEELQSAYRDLQHTQMQLIQREKMASVGQLVAGVAHELNNPIGFVFSNVTTLEDFVRRLRAMVETYRGLVLPAVDRERVQARWEELKVDYALRYLDSMIQGIREGAERTRKIVRDLRVFARTQEDVWQAVDLHEELESSLTLLNHLLKDRVRVHRKFGDLPSVECIRSQVDQVFLNLLANAAQAIDGEGDITLETRTENGWAVLTVTDSGRGIPADVIGRIFDPFFTTKPVGEGTGLGLSISYEIVKKHGGEITAVSPPGGGATFTVRLPVSRRT
ncbi:MAG: ATP-binding protein [Candidatus Rokuibacteriota bacterium]